MKPQILFRKLLPFLLLLLVGWLVISGGMDVNASSHFQSPVTPEPTTEPIDEPTAVPPTPEPTQTPSPQPTDPPVTLVLDGPSSVEAGQTFRVDVIAQNVPDPGLYGVQFEINFDSSLVAVGDREINSDLTYVVHNTVDNSAGNLLLVASQQGNVPGLTGDVVLLRFRVTATEQAGVAAFSFENEKFSDYQAKGFEINSGTYSVTIEQSATPVPTTEPTPKPTTEPTPLPTQEPTPKPTVEPTAEPTSEPTPLPTTEPEMAELSGQIRLPGRANNQWSGANVSVAGHSPTMMTDATGNFSMADVSAGMQTITADAPGYLSALCANVEVTAPATALAPVSLLSGDINGDDLVDVVDAAAVGTGFGQAGSDLPADITQDELIDIYDIVLVSVNYGEAGPQTWECAP